MKKNQKFEEIGKTEPKILRKEILWWQFFHPNSNNDIIAGWLLAHQDTMAG